MTRSEPLTSLALGRSPYDEVRMGEGEGDPRAPVQMYDEHGRPVNPDARRLNRELIRAHNEVMLAIGVAEPDDGAAERLEMQQRENAKMEAERIGHSLANAAHLVEITSAWGLNGLRSRILVYRQYSQIPFANIYHYERNRRSIPSLFLADFAPCLAIESLGYLYRWNRSIAKNKWLKMGLQYLHMHLHIFSCMRRLELIPQSVLFPRPAFFLPFTPLSPIPRPPPLRSFSPGDMVQWAGGVALSLAPFAAFIVYSRAAAVLRRRLLPLIYQYLPRPTNERVGEHSTVIGSDGEQSPSGWELVEDEGRNVLGPARGEVVDGNTGNERSRDAAADPLQVPTTRRQSTFSSARGGNDDYFDSDDEEDVERVSATLISFDVEAAEATDAPGAWSAELRANAPTDMGGGGGASGSGGADGSGQAPPPLYNDNRLTRLPAMLAADMLTKVCCSLLRAPVEAFALRILARIFLSRRGMSTFDVYDIAPWSGLSWTAVGNLLQVEMVHLILKGEIWSVFALISDVCGDEIQT